LKPAVLRASAGWLIRHPWQLGLALVGICIGIAVMVAVDLANESSRTAYRISMDTLNGRTTHQVIGGPGGVDEGIYVSLRTESGVRNIAPVVAGFVTVDNELLQVIGVDVFAEREFRSFTAPGDLGSDISGSPGVDTEDIVRQLLAGRGSLLLPDDFASRHRLEAGDEFDIVANGKRFVAAAAATYDGASQGLSNLAVADIAVAQHWLGMAGKLSRIDVPSRILRSDCRQASAWFPRKGAPRLLSI
jgi:putative ABC transport system permease protein